MLVAEGQGGRTRSSLNSPEVMLETSVDLRMRSGIHEFWSWMDQVSKDQTEVELLVSHRQKQWLKLVHARATRALLVSLDIGQVVGEKRKRISFTFTQTVFLEQAFGKGDLNRKEGRQKAC